MSISPPRFLADDLPEIPADQAKIHLFPTPLERSVSYGTGAGAGPAALLQASLQLEAYQDGRVIGDCGLYTHPPLDCAGDDPDAILRRIGEPAPGLCRENKIPFYLGGEHALTFGPVRALHEAGFAFGVVQFDAHADLRDRYQGDPFSHACVMRRIVELGIPTFSIGVRSLSAPEAALREERQLPHLDAADLMTRGYPDPLLPPGFPEHLYITFDIDAFDSSLMPSTGTPEPGGLLWYEAMEGLRRVTAGRQVLAMDLVELAPQAGQHGPDFIAAKLAYAMMGFAAST